jgi:hypothetical protein
MAVIPALANAEGFAQSAVGRYALVIGNGNYLELAKLKNPTNDATDMAAALKSLGFEVDLLVNADLVTMEDAVVRLGNRLSGSPSSMGFFFYAGHGVQSNGINYLIPADAHIPSESYLKTKALAAQEVLETVQAAKNGLNLVVLDACRDNPFGWARSGTRGLTVVGNQPPGSIVVYATSAGSVAQDGKGRNGLFTEELLKNLKVSGLEVGEIFKRTGAAVQKATKGQQTPAVYSQFFGSAYLGGGEGASSGSLQMEGANLSKPANLMVHASEDGADVLVDGVIKGKAPLLVQGIPTDHSVHIETRTAVSDGALDLSLKPGELREVTVSMAPLTGNVVILSDDSDVHILFDGTDRGLLGSGIFRDLPVGDHKLELVGHDLYFTGMVSVHAEDTVQVAAKLLPVGTLDIRAPADANTSIRGNTYTTSVTGHMTVSNVPTGSYRLEASGGDHSVVSTSVIVKKGSRTIWEPYATGSILLPRLGADVELSLDGDIRQGREKADGMVQYERVPTGYPVTVKFVLPGAESAIPDQTVSLAEGETAKLEVPAGRFTVPWLAKGSSVSIQGHDLKLEGSSSLRSPLLPVGTYSVTVSGKYPFTGDVTVEAQGETELPGYLEKVISSMSIERSDLQKSLAGKKQRPLGALFL